MNHFFVTVGLTVVIGSVSACGDVHGTHAPDAAPTTSDAPAADAPPVPAHTSVAVDASSFTVPDTTFVVVPYATVTRDTRNEWDVSRHAFVASRAGDIQICAALSIDQAAQLELDLFVDGQREKAFAYGTGIAQGCRSLRVAAGAVVDVRVLQIYGASVAAGLDPAWAWLTISEQTLLVSADSPASYSVGANQFVRIQGGAEAFDDRNEYDPATGTFQASQAGDYQICAGIYLGSGSSQRVQISLYVDGTRERELFAHVSAGTGCHIVRLTAGQTVDARVFLLQAQTVPADPYWSWLTVALAPARVSAGDSVAFSAPASTFTPVLYSSKLFDTASELDPTTSQFTASAAGDYEVCASLWDGADANPLELDVFIGGTREKGLGGPDFTPHGCRILHLAAGAVVQIETLQRTTGTVAVPTNLYWNWLTVRAL